MPSSFCTFAQEIKLSATTREDADEEVSAISKAKANLVSKISKKNLVENIVPVVISFKNMLEKKHSPLLRPLLTYLRAIMADHKQEVQGAWQDVCVNLGPFWGRAPPLGCCPALCPHAPLIISADIMAADRQLAQELTFDLKKFENDSRRASM